MAYTNSSLMSSLPKMAYTNSSLMSSLPFMITTTDSNSPSTRPTSVKFNRPIRVSASCASTAERSTSTSTNPHRFAGSSLYEVLGIPMGATCQEIKSAYRKLARVLHPDVNDDENKAGYEFMKVHEAYSTLCDPEKRADYDRLYFSQRSQQVIKPMTFGYGMRTRNWETDQCW
ncbi:hypothetical protein ACFE04_012822 [Oxalis oulophora]